MQNSYYILAINPGSTSMKMALYLNEERLYTHETVYTAEQLSLYAQIMEQLPLRLESVRSFIASMDPSIKLSAVVGRGGVLVPVQSGAYEVSELMIERLKNRPLGEHASNFGGILAYEIAHPLGIPAYVYDGVTVNEFNPLAFMSGYKNIVRLSRCHALNMRAMAMRAANEAGRNYKELNIIVVHMGGGITLSIHQKGRMVDVVLDSEGPFSPERAGRIPLTPLLRYSIAQGIDSEQLIRETRGKGGLVSLLGTNNALEVEKNIDQGDIMAELVYQTMAYQTAKAVGELATVVCGNVDIIVLTGAIAYSEMFTEWLIERISFISDIVLLPGEDELEALSMGALRVLRGEEKAHVYTKEIDEREEKGLIEGALKEFSEIKGKTKYQEAL